jgi:PD-(D/E)XK nuclease superfamily
MSALPNRTELWTTRNPTELSDAPEWMSYHFLRDAERCPLAASLKHSWYRKLWDRRGYPNRPNVGAYVGIIVHAAAELIVESMVAAKVSSATDFRAMATLRTLGGYSKVLSSLIDDLIDEESGNPRFVQVGPSMLRSLKSKIPQMREVLQQLLATRNWQSDSTSAKRVAGRGTSHSFQGQRFPLSVGTHFEVSLKDRQLMWTGRLDVVVVSNDCCSISDLKTASPEAEHHEQMRVYAMLWNGDGELNPKQTPLSALELVYGSGLVQVPVPIAGELEGLRTEIASRTNAIRNDLSLVTVPAKPSRENCRYCQVKLLCDRFWSDLRAFGSNADALSNVVLITEEARSDSTWFARISSSDSSLDSGRVILKKFDGGNLFWSEIKPGITLRLTDALVSLREPDELPLITLTMLSEALFM